MQIDRTPVWPAEWKSLRPKLGCEVSDELLQLALTHPSAVGEGVERTLKSNQRLEFLGDTILGAVVAEYLYRRFPELPEGDLTQRKAAIVQKTTLARVARRLELGNYLVLGRGESNAGGAQRDTILCDAIEAVMGAIHLSGGIEATRAFIERWFVDEFELATQASTVNIKNLLQEWTQANALGTPVYRIAADKGIAKNLASERRYCAQVVVDGVVRGQGEGRTKKAAETCAAQIAFDWFQGQVSAENDAASTCSEKNSASALENI